MARVELSGAADGDLAAIFTYTVREHGERQAERYLKSLEACFQRLAEQPDLARTADRTRPGYRRYEHLSHTIFLIRTSAGIRVVRVLHQRMDPLRHL